MIAPICEEGEDDVAPTKAASEIKKMVPWGVIRSVRCWPIGEKEYKIDRVRFLFSALCDGRQREYTLEPIHNVYTSGI
jgi:hypothetical protein